MSHRGRRMKHAPAIVVFCNTPTDDPLRLSLYKALPDALFIGDLVDFDSSDATLIFGVFYQHDHREILEFVRNTSKTICPTALVILTPEEALIALAVLHGEAGCGWCAFARMAAASGWDCTARAVEEPLREDALLVLGAYLVSLAQYMFQQELEKSLLLKHVLAIDFASGSKSLHKVIPLADCPVCGGARAYPQLPHSPVRLSPDDLPQAIFEALDGWVDSRTGVISAVSLEPRPERSEKLPFTVVTMPPTLLQENGSLRRLPAGWGKGLTVSRAMLSAIGEAIERYAPSLPGKSQMITARAADLDGEYMDPAALTLYTHEQYQRPGFPYARYNPEVPHPWVQGFWMGISTPVWLPAVVVYQSIEITPEQYICQGTSNGLAAGVDPAEAQLRAAFELIERDAFMTAWITKKPARGVILDGSEDPALTRVLEGIEELGAQVEVYSLPTSVCGVTFLCLALGDGEHYPGATIGLGADIDPRLALRQAVLELGQTGPYLRRLMRSGTTPIPQAPQSVHEMMQHATYFFQKERITSFDFLRSDPNPIPFGDMLGQPFDRSTGSLVVALKAKDISVALVDVTSADIAAGPFRVYRAVSSDLQPLWYGYGLERYLPKRLSSLTRSPYSTEIHPVW